MKRKRLSKFVVGILFGTVLLLGTDASVQADGSAFSVGRIFLEGKPHALRYVKGNSAQTYDQILLYDTSGEAVGTLAFKVHFEEATGTAIIENPLPIVSPKSDVSEGLLFDGLYAALFAHLLDRTPYVKEGLKIYFTDIEGGTVHPAISFALLRLGFQAIGGKKITIPMPQSPSITFELSNRYELTNPQRCFSRLSQLISGG